MVQDTKNSDKSKHIRGTEYVLARELEHLATKVDIANLDKKIDNKFNELDKKIDNKFNELDKKILTEEDLNKKLENYPTKEYIQKEFITIHKTLNSQFRWIIGIFTPLIICIIGILIKLLISNKL